MKICMRYMLQVHSIPPETLSCGPGTAQPGPRRSTRVAPGGPPPSCSHNWCRASAPATRLQSQACPCWLAPQAGAMLVPGVQGSCDAKRGQQAYMFGRSHALVSFLALELPSGPGRHALRFIMAARAGSCDSLAQQHRSIKDYTIVYTV